MEEKPAVVHVICRILADCSSQVSGQWHWAHAALFALPINKHHTVVVWDWPTKATLIAKSWTLSFGFPALVCVESSTRATKWEEATRGALGLLECTGGKTACRPCLDHLTWSTLGLHLVYTSSTPCLHLVYTLQPCSMFIRTNEMAPDSSNAFLPSTRQALSMFVDQRTASLWVGSTQHYSEHTLPTTHGSYGL